MLALQDICDSACLPKHFDSALSPLLAFRFSFSTASQPDLGEPEDFIGPAAAVICLILNVMVIQGVYVIRAFSFPILAHSIRVSLIYLDMRNLSSGPALDPYRNTDSDN
jgi:hypothetical protein